jgi:hypothetical protein
VGSLSRTLVWDREAAIGASGRPSAAAAAFAGTLGMRIKLTPARDPESKGLIERRNGYFETSFLRPPPRIRARRVRCQGSRHPHATDHPGFTVDEPQLELGRSLKLPPWLEPNRDQIAASLPPLHNPDSDDVEPDGGGTAIRTGVSHERRVA